MNPYKFLITHHVFALFGSLLGISVSQGHRAIAVPVYLALGFLFGLFARQIQRWTNTP